MVWPILGLFAGFLLRGPTISKSTTEAVANIRQNTNVSSQTSCNNNQVISTNKQTYVIGQILCDNFSIGNTTAVSNATCEQYQDIAVIAKTLADQAAKSEAESTGVSLGLFSMATANASTYVDVQNNIAALIAASCTNSQKVSLDERSFTAGVIQGQQCNILNDSFTQEALCTQTILATIQNDVNVKQDVQAKATAGLDLGQVILFFLLLFGGFFLLMLFGSLVKSLFRSGSGGSSASSGLFGSGGVSVGELTSKRNALRAAVSKQAELVAANAAFPSILRR
jgi:hypothetical protein